jgi:hypothetical protein
MSGEADSVGEAALAECRQLEKGFADLVIEVRGREILPALREHALSLVEYCKRTRLVETSQLAGAVARCCGLLYQGDADPGQALPLLASGAQTLHRAIASTTSTLHVAPTELCVGAARYELESLFPVSGEPAKANKTGPDVKLHSLRRRKPSSDTGDK